MCLQRPHSSGDAPEAHDGIVCSINHPVSSDAHTGGKFQGRSRTVSVACLMNDLDCEYKKDPFLRRMSVNYTQDQAESPGGDCIDVATDMSGTYMLRAWRTGLGL